MLGKIATILGVIVGSLIVVGTLLGGKDVAEGKGDIEDIPARIAEQFAEAGFSAPPAGYRQDRPQPYGSVPYGTDLPGQLRQPASQGSLLGQGR